MPKKYTQMHFPGVLELIAAGALMIALRRRRNAMTIQ
jgi:hypothetical protein